MDKQIQNIESNSSVTEMVHELRNPLCSLMGSFLFIKRYLNKIEKITLTDLDEVEKEYLISIQSKVKRSVEIVENSNKQIKKLIDDFGTDKALKN